MKKNTNQPAKTTQVQEIEVSDKAMAEADAIMAAQTAAAKAKAEATAAKAKAKEDAAAARAALKAQREAAKIAEREAAAAERAALIASAPVATKVPADPRVTRAKMSEGQVQSWKVPEVRAKRAERSAVDVDGETYTSVYKAFLALGLPVNKHIAFRGELKEAGKLTRFGHEWEIIPLNY